MVQNPAVHSGMVSERSTGGRAEPGPVRENDANGGGYFFCGKGQAPPPAWFTFSLSDRSDAKSRDTSVRAPGIPPEVAGSSPAAWVPSTTQT